MTCTVTNWTSSYLGRYTKWLSSKFTIAHS